MIIVSASMMKAGSGWYFNLANTLLAAHGGDDAREVRRRWRLGGLLKDHNCRIGSLRAHRLAPLLLPHAAGARFAVKTHADPTPSLRALIKTGAVRATFNLRDPRDIAVSAFDHGTRQRESKTDGLFAGLTTVDEAIDFVAENLLPVWEGWAATPTVLLVRYEQLVADPVTEVLRLAEFCGVRAEHADAQDVVAKVSADLSGSDALHFNSGTTGRHAEVMSRAQLAHCNRAFGARLTAMGYA
jgi:hypothetical protein